MTWALAAAAALSLAGGAEAQVPLDPETRLEPARLEEGRPVGLRLVWRNGAGAPRVLAWLLLEAGGARVEARPGRSCRAASLEPLHPDLVTLELTAAEDLGPVARAPRPPRTVSLEGEPCRVLQVSASGAEVAVEVLVIPLAPPGTPADLDPFLLPVEARRQVLDLPEAAMDLGRPLLYRVEQRERWSPGQEGDAPPGLRPGPGGPGGERVGLEAELVRWAPWGGDQVPTALLVREGDLPHLAGRGPVVHQAVVPVSRARFGLTAALRRAGLERGDAAVRLSDDRWVLQQGETWHLVPPQGEGLSGAGQLFPWIIALAGRGEARLMWYGHGELPRLAQALREAGFVGADGKGLEVVLTPERLVPFLELVGRHGGRLDGVGIVPAR